MLLSAIRRTLTSIRLVKFICGEEKFVGNAKVNDSLLDVVVNNDLNLDGYGACDGTLACCTCMVNLEPEHFKAVKRVNPISEDENDLLDIAPSLTDYSRLGCQVKIAADDPAEIAVFVPTLKRDARQL